MSERGESSRGATQEKAAGDSAVELDAVLGQIGRQLGRRGVGADDHLQEDLGVESVDLLSLIAALEERYGVEVADEDIESIETAGDLYRLFRRLA